MVLLAYNPEFAKRQFQENYHQAGGMNIFHGSKYQRGYGLGNILSGLFRSAVPLLKKGAISLGKTALKTGLNVAKDGLMGKNIKSSLKTNVRRAGKDILGNVIHTATNKLAKPSIDDDLSNHMTYQMRQPSNYKNRKRKASTVKRRQKAKRERLNNSQTRDIFS